MNPWILSLSVLGFFALIGLFIILFDEGLKRPGDR